MKHIEKYALVKQAVTRKTLLGNIIPMFKTPKHRVTDAQKYHPMVQAVLKALGNDRQAEISLMAHIMAGLQRYKGDVKSLVNTQQMIPVADGKFVRIGNRFIKALEGNGGIDKNFLAQFDLKGKDLPMLEKIVDDGFKANPNWMRPRDMDTGQWLDDLGPERIERVDFPSSGFM